MSVLQRIVAPVGTCPTCPAADLVGEAPGGTGCVCRITRDLIDSRRNQSTLRRFCFNRDGLTGYQTCPTWRADREAEWATKTHADLLNHSGDLRTGHPEDRERDQGLERGLEAREYSQWLDQQQS